MAPPPARFAAPACFLALACSGPSGPEDSADAGGPDTAQPTVSQAGWQARAANNRDYLPAILDIIEQSQVRLHLVQFEVSPYGPVLDIFDALEDAVQRGVDVMLLADEAASSTQGALEILSSAGIQASLDSAYTTTHNKLVVSDEQVLVGSTNFSTSSIDYNNEVDLWIRSAAATEYYESYFQALWADSDSDPQLTWEGDQDLLPLSNRDILGAELACMEGAAERINVVMYAMTYHADSPDASSTRLVDSLVEAHEAGIQVRVILDASSWITENHINDDAAMVLHSAGVDIRFTESNVITHAKLLTCDETVIVSDANWSVSGMDYYNGTSVQVNDAEIYSQYSDYFELLWKSATP